MDGILKEIPEVDAIIGIGANGDIVDIIKKTVEGETVYEMPENTKLPLVGERLLTTPEHWAYLKIADGCDNFCTYCIVPYVRGRERSRSPEAILAEAKKLADNGTKEITLWNLVFLM